MKIPDMHITSFTIPIEGDACGMSLGAFLEAMNANRIGTGVHYLSLAEHA